MNIIITGASGFVGQNLSRFLKEKANKVECISLRGEWMLDANSTALIHLAGKAHDIKKTSADAAYYEINTKLTQKLYDDFLYSEIKDFIYFSSVKASADQVNGILNETQICNPQTAYGKSKLMAEEYILSRSIPEGKRVFIIRPCMIHGPGNKGNLNLLYKVVQKKIPWPLAAFENKRSFLSIDNLNFLVSELLADKKVPSGIYNFADDQPLSTNELIKIIATALGLKPRLWHTSKTFITGLAKLGDKLKLPLNSERLKKLTESYIVSNEKIKKAIGIDHLPVTVEDGLRNTISSFIKSNP